MHFRFNDNSALEKGLDKFSAIALPTNGGTQ